MFLHLSFGGYVYNVRSTQKWTISLGWDGNQNGWETSWRSRQFFWMLSLLAQTTDVKRNMITWLWNISTNSSLPRWAPLLLLDTVLVPYLSRRSCLLLSLLPKAGNVHPALSTDH